MHKIVGMLLVVIGILSVPCAVIAFKLAHQRSSALAEIEGLIVALIAVLALGLGSLLIKEPAR